ncbi:MAG: ABC transporter substrate-binding protein [Chloroflexi bacterium]|nr:ABC transporter substrate-binding protein [Chloroflexota bacterium]
MDTDGYWTRRGNRGGVGRRAVLRGGVLGGASLAAAFALACGGDDKKTDSGSSSGTQTSGSPGAAAQAQLTPHPEVASAKRGGTFEFDQSDEPISLDNHRQETPGSIQAANLSYNHLLRRWEDFLKAPGVINIDGELAQAWEQVDKTTYKFSLVRNAKWHNIAPVNGRAFTADDVKYSLERMKGSDPELRTRSAMEPIDSIETPDQYTVVVKTKEPFAPFINHIGHTWNVIMARELGDTPDVNRKAIGTGPFIFKEWQRGVSLRFDRNPEYWRINQPFFERVIMRVVPNTAARAANFRAGETNIWGGSPPTVPYETIDEMKKALPDVTEIRREGSNNSGTKAFFNTTAAPFNDKRVRQAFLYGADYESITKIFGGLAKRAGPMPLASIWGLKDADFPKTDVAKAKQLLEAAGVSTPLKVKTTISAEYSGPAVSQILQQVMKPVGVEIEINQIENAAWISKVYRGGQDYQMTSFGDWSWEDPDRGLYAYFHSKGNANNTHFSNPQADSLLEKQRVEFDLEARKKLVRDLQLLLVDEAPQVWLVSTGGIELIRARLKNYKQMQMGNTNGYRQWEFCWFDPAPGN